MPNTTKTDTASVLSSDLTIEERNGSTTKLSNGLTVAEQNEIDAIMGTPAPQNFDELFEKLRENDTERNLLASTTQTDSSRLSRVVNMKPWEREMEPMYKTMLNSPIKTVGVESKFSWPENDDGWTFLNIRDWPLVGDIPGVGQSRHGEGDAQKLKDYDGNVIGTVSLSTAHKDEPNWLHYEGELGEFDYNSEYFEICQRAVDPNDASKGYVTFLHATEKAASAQDNHGINVFAAGGVYGENVATKYITHTDSEDGILIGDYLFADTAVGNAGTLPDTLTSCHGMYAGCSNLENITADMDSNNWRGEEYGNWPPNVEDLSGMFYGCSKIAWEGFGQNVPTSVVDVRNMFNGCEKLSNCPDFSKCEYLSPTMMGGIYNRTQLVEVKQEPDPETGELMNVVELSEAARSSKPNKWHNYNTQSEYLNSIGHAQAMAEGVLSDTEKFKDTQTAAAMMDYADASDPTLANSIRAATDGLAAEGVFVDENGNTYGTTELNDIEDKEVSGISKFFSGLGLNIPNIGSIGGHLAGGVGDYAILRAVTGSKVIGLCGALGLQAIGATQETATPLLTLATKILPEGNGLRTVLEEFNKKLHPDAEEDIDASNYQANFRSSVYNMSNSLQYATLVGDAGSKVMTQLSQEMVANGTLSELANRSTNDLKSVHNTMASTLDNCMALFKNGDFDVETQRSLTKDYMENIVMSMKFYNAGVYDHSVGRTDQVQILAGAEKYLTSMEVPLYDRIIQAQEDSKVVDPNNPLFSAEEWQALCDKTESVGQISLNDYYQNYYLTGKSFINEFYTSTKSMTDLAKDAAAATGHTLVVPETSAADAFSAAVNGTEQPAAVPQAAPAASPTSAAAAFSGATDGVSPYDAVSVPQTAPAPSAQPDVAARRARQAAAALGEDFLDNAGNDMQLM